MSGEVRAGTALVGVVVGPHRVRDRADVRFATSVGNV
jgi:hypothetical protein